MCETGEGNPIDQLSSKKHRQQKYWGVQSDEKYYQRVTDMHTNGLPDALISNQLGISLEKVKSIRKHLSLAPMTSAQSTEARRRFLSQLPNKHEITPPPIDDLENE